MIDKELAAFRLVLLAASYRSLAPRDQKLLRKKLPQHFVVAVEQAVRAVSA